MGRTLMIGQTACYWSKGATKPLAALVLDFEGDTATLSVHTIEGGRFTKKIGPKVSLDGEGWGEVGQSFRE